MKKIFALFGLLLCVPAMAEEAEEANTDVAVVERVSCADMQARIKELSEVEDDTGDVADEIAKLTQEYRRACMRAAAGRRTTTAARVSVVEAGEEDVVESEDVTEDVEDDGVSTEEVIETEEIEKTELTPEQELENLDAGLCADGTKPNRFGCCGDEIFKDLGNTVFACCPKSGGDDSDCFPPIK